MYYIIWEYIVKEEKLNKLEEFYGNEGESGGVWDSTIFNFIDAADVNFDEQNELIFYKSGGEAHGFLSFIKR